MATTRRLLSSVAALLLLTAVASSSPPPTTGAVKSAALPGCQASCGGVDIPYPFGIGANCFHDSGFEISCDGSTPFLTSSLVTGNMMYKVLSLSVAPLSEAQVELPVAWSCIDASGRVARRSDAKVLFNPHGVYRISHARNQMVVVGCNAAGYIQSGAIKNSSGAPPPYDYAYYTGCTSYCVSAESAVDGHCAGLGCCKVDIPPGMTDNSIAFSDVDNHPYFYSFSQCSYGFLVDRESYKFRRADLSMDLGRMMPVWLDWAIRPPPGASSAAMACADARMDEPSYACKSKNSECFPSANGPGYICKCSQGYEGNAYIVDGCTDIDECSDPMNYTCYGICSNTEGSYECRCQRGSHGDPKNRACAPNFSRAAQISIEPPPPPATPTSPTPRAVHAPPPPCPLSMWVICGISFLIVMSTFMVMERGKRKLRAYFERNGGPLLKKINNIKIFTKEELDHITRNYSTVLGKGSLGEVYMGNMDDNQKVAVKRSIAVDNERKKEFANEIEIQSQINHKNVIRLLGCCLEVDIPILVYEFAPNGSLYDLLHGNKDNTNIPLGLRLDIAMDSVEALVYMHSYATRRILHGDVKSRNILLDDNFIPKVSDFGTSKFLTINKVHVTFVVGDLSYIDPIYMKTGILTEKSDVYSFGVVLLELITRKKPRSDQNKSLVVSFIKSCKTENQGIEMFDEEIASTGNIDCLRKVGRIAMLCLKEDVDERPAMREVAEDLEHVRRELMQRQGRIHKNDDQAREISIEIPPSRFTADANGAENPNPDKIPPFVKIAEASATRSPPSDGGELPPPSTPLLHVASQGGSDSRGFRAAAISFARRRSPRTLLIHSPPGPGR